MRGTQRREYEIEFLVKVLTQLEHTTQERPLNLTAFDRKRMCRAVKAIDELLVYVPLTNLEDMNNLQKAIAHVVAKEVGFKRNSGTHHSKISCWKRRKANIIKQLRKYISQLTYMKAGTMWQRLENWKGNIFINEKGLDLVIEELKHQINTKSAKLMRYENRCDQFPQNRLFQNNQKRLWKRLEGI